MMMTKLGQGPATVRIGCEIHNNITFQPKIYKKTLTFQRCGGGGGHPSISMANREPLISTFSFCNNGPLFNPSIVFPKNLVQFCTLF